ncbi:hypothetical protein [Streptomyces sp. KR80]|uniref:hypothetical protein n=1 Tax=Streptomyces sp. KR80 TaxID=3457426 RepID=UPI003FD0E89D
MAFSTISPAWGDSATRQGWRTSLLQELVGVLCAGITFPAWLFATVMTPRWLVPLWVGVGMAVALHILYRVAQLFSLVQIRRVLKVYAWSSAVARTADKPGCRFEGVNPDNPAQHVSVRLRMAFAGRLTYWGRWCRAHDGQEVHFCGDPRFVGVVAHRDVQKGRLRLVAQREAVDRRMSPRRKGVTQEARERALAVGARVG